jgi:hypothetical protein
LSVRFGPKPETPKKPKKEKAAGDEKAAKK